MKQPNVANKILYAVTAGSAAMLAPATDVPPHPHHPKKKPVFVRRREEKRKEERKKDKNVDE